LYVVCNISVVFRHSVGLFVRIGVASVGLTIVQVAHLHQGLWAEGAHNLTAFSRSMTATVGLRKTPNKQRNCTFSA